MGLSLLAPAALAVAAAVALPVLAHLSRQTPRHKRAYGAMLLLERVVKRLRRRRRVKDWLLLLARAAALVAIAVGAAGPQLTVPGGVPEYGGSGRVVVVLDRSMSMRLLDGGETLLQRAVRDAVEVVEALPEGTLVGAVVFDRQAVRLVPALTADRARVADKLERTESTWGRSNLREALLESRRLLGGEPGEVLLFSDEAGPTVIAEAKGEIERLVGQGSAVLPRTIRAEPARNVALASARYGEGLEGGSVTVRLVNYGPDPIEVACEVTLPDQAVIPIFADLPPDGEAEERITIPREADGGVGNVRCEDPDLPADDVRYFHLPRVGASRVLVVDGDPGDTPTRSEIYFLERALAPWGGARAGLALDVATPVGLQTLDAEEHRVVFLANVADPRPFGPRLTEFVRSGGSLVIGGGNNVTAARYNAALGAVLPSPLRKARPVAALGEEGVPVAIPDLATPLLAPFARYGGGGFGRIRARTLLTLEPFEESGDDLATLLHYENGMPALVERRIGKGRVLVWTGTFDLDWGNLPLQAVFMPLVQRMVSYLGGDAGGQTARFDATVGERVSIPLPDLVLDPEVLGPGGRAVHSRIEGSSIVFTPDEPGAYELHLDSAPPLAWVAVNTDPIESDVRAYDSVLAVERELAPDLLVQQHDLGRGFLAFGLLLLAAQSLLAARGVA